MKKGNVILIVSCILIVTVVIILMPTLYKVITNNKYKAMVLGLTQKMSDVKKSYFGI